MEKRRPHYDLRLIQQQMDSVAALNLTISARNGMKAIGIALVDAVTVVQSLSPQNFYKAMTVYADNRMWQDVYHAEWKGRLLYIKFQRIDEFFIVSFKER